MATDTRTALHMRPDGAEWTVWKPSTKGDPAVRREAWSRPEDGGDEAPPAAESVAAVLKKDSEIASGRLILALPSEKALLRVMNFPSTDPEELQGMVDLQMGKISPFPVEQLAISFEVLSQTADHSHVLMMAAPLKEVEELGRPFIDAHLKPERVDVDVLGYGQLLAEREQLLEHGREFILLLREDQTDLIILQDRVPLLFRSFSSPEGLSIESFTEELVEETMYSMTALEAEWGAAAVARIRIFGEDALCAPARAQLKEQTGLPVESTSLEPLQPLSQGLAMRAAITERVTGDLAPAAWKKRIKTQGVYRQMMKAGIAVAALWLLMVIGSGALTAHRAAQQTRLEARATELEAPAEQIKRIRSRVQALEDYSDRSRSALECLREVSALLPGGLELTSFNYRKEIFEVSLRGFSRSVNKEPIINFIQQLENSEFFASVKSQQVTTRTTRGQRRSQFNIDILLPGGDEEVTP